MRKYKRAHSRFKGVTKVKNYWVARVYEGSNVRHLGCYPTEWQAYARRKEELRTERNHGISDGF